MFLNYFGIFKERSTYVMEMEIGLIDLQSLLKQRKKDDCLYTQEEIFYILLHLLDQFIFLEEHNIAHRDVKSGNIVIIEREKQKNLYKYKLADFGEAIKLKPSKIQRKTESFAYTKAYAAPEVINDLNRNYNLI